MKHFTNSFRRVGQIIVARVGKLIVGQGSFPRNFRKLFHLKFKRPNQKYTSSHLRCQKTHLNKAIDLNHIFYIDFGGGDADSVVLIAWHLGIDKSCVLALLLYQESDIQAKLLHFFFFFLRGGGRWTMNGWWMDNDVIVIQAHHMYVDIAVLLKNICRPSYFITSHHISISVFPVL